MRHDNHNQKRAEAEIAASPRAPRRKPSEDGYGLLVVVFLLTIMTLWLAVAVPKMTRSIQRDHEVETMHRGKQYIRAVQLYYRKFHAYPPSMDALVKTNEIRFLRKKYIDPVTGKDDWKPLMFGQNKQPIVFGFFGQPLATGSTIAGIGMSGGNGINGPNGAGGPGGAGSRCATGSLASIFTCQQSPTGATGSTGGLDTSGSSTSGSGSGTSTTDANGNPVAGSATGGSGGTDANGSPTGGAGTNGLSSTGSTAGQTFGGAGIIGVTPISPKPSLLVYKKTSHYKEWEFDYDPAMEMQTQATGGAGLNGTPASNMSNPIGGVGGSPNNPFGTPPSNTPGGINQPPPSQQPGQQ